MSPYGVSDSADKVRDAIQKIVISAGERKIDGEGHAPQWHKEHEVVKQWRAADPGLRAAGTELLMEKPETAPGREKRDVRGARLPDWAESLSDLRTTNG